MGPGFKILCCVFAPHGLPKTWHLEGTRKRVPELNVRENFVTASVESTSRDAEESVGGGLAELVKSLGFLLCSVSVAAGIFSVCSFIFLHGPEQSDS